MHDQNMQAEPTANPGTRESGATRHPLHLEHRPTAALTLRKGNPRTHSEKQIRQIADIIRDLRLHQPGPDRRRRHGDRRPWPGRGGQAARHRDGARPSGSTI